MWLAPEALSGVVTYLTKKIDVYAFGIVCAEILNKGAPPWGLLASPELVHNLVCRQFTESLRYIMLTLFCRAAQAT